MRPRTQWQKCLWVNYAVIAVTATCSAVLLRKRELLFHEYNGDVDTFLYQAWRLLEGKLNYIDHYDSKLPIVPYLYTPSFLTGSFGGHRFVADLILLASAFLIYCLSFRAIRDISRLDRKSSRNGGLVSATLYIFFGTLLPDTVYSGHLFLFASFFLLSGLLLIFNGFIQGREWLTATGGSICGFAIQTRPNTLFGLAGLIAAFYACYLSVNHSGLTRHDVNKSLRQLSIASAAGALGFLLPFFPYSINQEHAESAFSLSFTLLKTWRRDVFGWEDLAHFASSIHYLYTPRLFGIPYLFALPIPALAAGMLTIYLSRKRKAERRGAVAVYCSLLGYIAGIVCSYFYSHTFPNYVFADLWAYALLAGFSVAIIMKRLPIQGFQLASLYGVLIASSLSLAMLFQATRVNRQEDSRTFFLPEDLLSTLEASSFSSPENYSLYWRLKQKASTFGVHTHWTEYANFKIRDKHLLRRLGLTASVQETCDEYLDKNNKFLVLFADNKFICKDNLNAWTLVKSFDYRKDGPPVKLYVNSLHPQRQDK